MKLITTSIMVVLFLGSCSKAKLEYRLAQTVNPNELAPLTAELKLTANMPCAATLTVLGEAPLKQEFDTIGRELTLPVLGLYPGTRNRVLVELAYEGGTLTDTISIPAAPLPEYFPEITIDTLNREAMEPGWHGLDIHFANFGKFRSAPIVFDDNGTVRWYLDLSFHGAMVAPFQRLSNGNILAVGRHTIYEFDMMGKQLRKREIPNNYGMHHDVLELPNGDFLICVGKRDAKMVKDGQEITSDSDFIVHYDNKNSLIVREWDMAKHLDVNRDDLNMFREGDWFHMNALEFDPRDSTIIVSGRNQGLVKISWDDELKWIMAPKQNWGSAGRDGKGKATRPYLLTAVDGNNQPYGTAVQNGRESAEDFDFPWGPHAPRLLPNGNIIVFDNGPFRNYNNENNYSRAVEYEIDEEDLRFRQVWEYGKARGMDFFSSIVSEVDYLPGTENILITSGFLNPGTRHAAKIVEVDPDTNKEVFEATLYFKDTNKGQERGWGQSDILYRSERMPLKF